MLRPRSFENLKLDRVHLGLPLGDAVLAEADERAADRIAIVASKSVVTKTEVIRGLESVLGARFAGCFDRTREHVPRDGVLELAGFLRDRNADLVVTVGGGTPIDTVNVRSRLRFEMSGSRRNVRIWKIW